MTFVIDASVAAKWFVREEFHDQAVHLLVHRERLTAPDLIITEVANIAWKKCIKGEITKIHARTMATATRNFIPKLHPSAEMTERALNIALALNHPVYDCLYLACAEGVGGVLVTADIKLCKAVKDTPFASLISHLGAIN